MLAVLFTTRLQVKAAFPVKPLIGLPLEFGNNKIDKYEAKNVLEKRILRHTDRRQCRNKR